MGKRVFDESAVMTALCLWEATINLNKEVDDNGDLTPIAQQLEDMWDGYGTFTMRQACIDLAHECDVAFEAADALGYSDSFDFDFCPQFIRGVVESGRFDEAVTGQFGRAVKAA